MFRKYTWPSESMSSFQTVITTSNLFKTCHSLIGIIIYTKLMHVDPTINSGGAFRKPQKAAR